MKIFVICSKRFYSAIPQVQKMLEASGHRVTLPNSYDDPNMESKQRALGHERHTSWKAEMLRHSVRVIEDTDAVLVLNLDRDGVQNYIGGATFLEMYDAFRLGKKIFLLNDIPDGLLRDEILGFNPTVINGDLGKVL